MLPQLFPVACHTDNIGPGSIFVAIKGVQTDGSLYIKRAIEKGAIKIVADATCQISPQIYELCLKNSIPLEIVANARKELALLSAQYNDFPAKKLRIIGITGTKGKTTSSFMFEHLLRQQGFSTALLSTVYNKIGTIIFSTHLTTQHPDYLHVFLKKCFEESIDYVIMEVAAQAISLWRTYGIEFDALLFTNFAKEHGEFYSSQEEYFQAKKTLLCQRKHGAPAILNGDDAWIKSRTTLVSNALFFSQKKEIYTFCVENLQPSGTLFSLAIADEKYEVFTKLIGEFNVYNWVGVLTTLHALGMQLSPVIKGVDSFQGAPGRLELHTLPNGASCYIDYAHNPLSFEAVLSTLRLYTDHLIAVFGAGGDRDPSRRPLMGEIAARYADLLILTSDNPRSEDPQRIIQDIYDGIKKSEQKKVVIVLNRAQAIEQAYAHSKSGSILILLGKGPEQYQLIDNKKEYFSEASILKSFI